MRFRCWESLLLSLTMAAAAAAQPLNVGSDAGGGAAKTPEKPAVATPPRPTPGGPMRLGDEGRKGIDSRRGFGQGRGQEIDKSALDPKRLEEELKLEWRQKEEIQQIFREYEAAIRDIRQQHQGGSSEQERRRLEQDLKAARQSRDTQRAAEIMKQMADLRTSASDEEQQYQEILIEEIDKVLDENQRTQFHRMLRPKDPRNQVRGPLEDPEVLFECLKEVKLEEYQKGQIERIQKDSQDELKRRGQQMQPDEKKMLGERVLREVLTILNDDQEKQLRQVHAKMGGPGAGGGPIDLSDPMQLQYAIGRLNTTKDRLSAEQNTELMRIRRDYFQELRSLPRDDENGRKRLSEQVSQQVMTLLTPEQQEAVKGMEAPAGRYSRSGRHRDRDRSGRGDDDVRPTERSRESRSSDRSRSREDRPY
ncbi:MAG: hypothetical protein JXQ73_08030 [Phycisphaerae bacterium]|nr:hypothetical protein [Phycisphaerae bacterium]